MFLKSLIKRIFPKFFCVLKYIHVFNSIPNIIKPKTFNEKILCRKIFSNDPRYSLLSDKAEVKKWVREKIGNEYVNENLLVCDKLYKTELVKLLASNETVFVKANHNSGPVFKVRHNDNEQHIENVVRQVNEQLSYDYSNEHNELWYKTIDRKILVERSLSHGDYDILDFKFHCFNGESFDFVLHVDFDRNSNHNRSWFNSDLKYLPFSNEYPSINRSIEMPENFDIMVDIVKKLSSDFDYVRVDLYNVAGQIYFGEMTFAHEAGYGKFEPQEYDKILGDMWK